MPLDEIVKPVIRWFTENRKELPFRQNRTPYSIWISEIMLQQTRIETVIPYYLRFIREFPDVAALAAADPDRLMKLWEGLGYYSRARNLKKAAEKVVQEHGGQLPADAKALKSLPGIGEYTAGAIASMAFGLPVPAVDGNVLRVITRVTADFSDISEAATKKKITRMLAEVYPTGEEAAKLTEGLMEIGETVCLPVAEPKCGLCPLFGICLAEKQGIANQLPVLPERKVRKKEQLTVFLLRCGDTFALCKRTRGMLKETFEFPNCPGYLSRQQVAEKFGIPREQVVLLGASRHIFTHREWEMIGYEIPLPKPLPEYRFETASQILSRYAVPSAFRAYKVYLEKFL